MASADARVTSAHRFTPEAIETTWTVTRAAGAGELSADVSFPSWGRGARVVARMRDGSRRRVTGRPLALARVAAFEVRGARSGYVVVPRSAPRGATVFAYRPAPQSSAPEPGPSLCVSLARSARFKTMRLAVRIILGLSRTVGAD